MHMGGWLGVVGIGLSIACVAFRWGVQAGMDSYTGLLCEYRRLRILSSFSPSGWRGITAQHGVDGFMGCILENFIDLLEHKQEDTLRDLETTNLRPSHPFSFLLFRDTLGLGMTTLVLNFPGGSSQCSRFILIRKKAMFCVG